ncbi:LysR family transcriptional regulator [Streptococcus lactarius]|uniref:LysR family transcriptional regulator n=1 Tax=Streptococcus lactarius TaxID=684066 RepID=A0A9X1BC77_9STRE|nr:LysR family transcriptional regulator [Streptococcus lactarius]
MSWPLFACLKKESKMDLSNDTSVSRMKRKFAIIEREFEKGECHGSYCS